MLKMTATVISSAQPCLRPSIGSSLQNPRRTSKWLKADKFLPGLTFSPVRMKLYPLLCTKLTPWDPSPVTYASPEKGTDTFLKESTNIFENLEANNVKISKTDAEELSEEKYNPSVKLELLKWPLWLLGPTLLLATGMVPTLWLPLSSVFIGTNIASLFSLIGLDCIFNIGATIFLLMADSCAHTKFPTEARNSKVPSSYKFWNIVASVTGFVVPLLMMFGSQRGLFQPALPSISFAVLLGPYLLLQFVQVLTEMLTWHWRSPVWLVTPIVYESYRVLQLMRGLKLGVEIGAPAWMMHTIRGLVSWWVLILGMQLMRVAWFAGFAAKTRQNLSSSAVASVLGD